MEYKIKKAVEVYNKTTHSPALILCIECPNLAGKEASRGWSTAYFTAYGYVMTKCAIVWLEREGENFFDDSLQMTYLDRKKYWTKLGDIDRLKDYEIDMEYHYPDNTCLIKVGQ